MSAASTIVRLAARTLSTDLRGRYREQWLADLRDAEEAGIHPSEIAIGSLAFAATLARPLFPSARTPTAAGVLRRSRLASGLALSTALLALGHYWSVVQIGGPTGYVAYDFTIFLATSLVLVYAAGSLFVALALVTFTRGMGNSVRSSVWMLSLAAFAPLAQGEIDSRWYGDVENMYLTRGMWSYVGAAALIVTACILLWREFRGTVRTRRNVRSAVIGGLGLLAGSAVSLASAVATWEASPGPVWVDPITPANQRAFDAWARDLAAFEQLATNVFALAAVVGLVSALLVASTGFSRRMTPHRILWLSLGAACMLLMADVGLTTFLQLWTPTFGPTSPPDALRLVAQWGLVATVLYSIGGVRYGGRAARRVHSEKPSAVSAQPPT